MSETVTADVIEAVFDVNEDDVVHVTDSSGDVDRDMNVVDIVHDEWDLRESVWETREILLEDDQEQIYYIGCAQDADDVRLREDGKDGDVIGTLERFELTGVSIEDDQVLSEAPTVALEEQAVDDPPEDTVDSIDEKSDTEIELPGDAQEDDVDELTSGGIELGELAEELDVHPNRARAIAFKLGFYSRVREVKYRGGL